MNALYILTLCRALLCASILRIKMGWENGEVQKFPEKKQRSKNANREPVRIVVIRNSFQRMINSVDHLSPEEKKSWAYAGRILMEGKAFFGRKNNHIQISQNVSNPDTDLKKLWN